MRALMFGWEYPPNFTGGLGTACFHLTNALSFKNLEILFVVPWSLPGTHSRHLTKLITPFDYPAVMKKFPLHYKQVKKVEAASILNPYMNPETYRECLERLARLGVDASRANFLKNLYGADLFEAVARYTYAARYIVRSEHFDVIHAHDWMCFQAGVLAKKLTGKPLVVHVHSTEFDRSGNSINQQIYDIEKYGMESADKIIAVSKRTKGLIVSKYGIDESKVAVIYNATESRRKHLYTKVQSAYGNDKVVLFLGRITLQKGPEYFLDAAKKVLDKMPNTHFIMAGSGDLTSKLIKKMAELKLTERFHFTGFVDGADKDYLFAISDLYVMPSVSEPFGITPLEALEHGVPVIVSKQSGVSEILDSSVVNKVDFWDVDALSNGIISVLSDPNIRAKSMAASKKLLSNVTWDEAANRVLAIYSNALQ